MSEALGQLAFLRRNYCVLKREREYACDVIEAELKAFAILNKHLHFEMAVDDNVGCLFTRLFNDNICVIAWVEGKEYLDIFKKVFKYYEEKPIPINEAKLKELINERFKKEGKTIIKTEAIWKD